MSRVVRMTLSSRFAILFAFALVLAPAGAPATADDSATASRSCKVGNSQSYGTTYVRWIRARNVSCRRARGLVRAFHDCRKGPRGRCGRVRRYRCTENRSYSPIQFDSTVRCKRGGKVVRHAYTQNL